MRMAEARLTIAVGEASKGNLDDALGIGLAALTASRKSLPSLLMVASELDAALQQRWPNELAVEDFREAVRSLG